jgi:hypothetical protein
MSYSERDLVHTFMSLILERRSPFTAPRIASEFNYLNGKTDVIALGKNHRLIGFEAKMTKWKDALHQAYKNATFCHLSYVLVPAEVSTRAARARELFLQRRVGLCSLDKRGRIKIAIPAPFNRPLQPWLTKSAKEFILKNSDARKARI